MMKILQKFITKSPRVIPILTILCISIAVISSTLFFSKSAHAELDNATLDFFETNGIYYYNPSGGCNDEINSGGENSAGTVSGNGYPEKIWNYFVSANIPGISDNPAAIAGIMGNLSGESGLDPFGKTGSYHGIYQTDSQAVIKAVEKLGNYWHADGEKSKAPSDIIDKAIKIELDYLINDKVWSEKRWKLYVDALKKYNIGSSEEDAKKAAEFFMLAVERCYDAQGKYNPAPLDYEESRKFAREINSVTAQYANKMWQGTKRRRDDAVSFYKKFAKSTPSSGSSSGSSNSKSNGSNVTIIGDSITEMSKSDIKELLPKASINSKVGRQFAKSYDDSGYENLEKTIKDNKLRDILVFALGTNDSGLKEKQVKEVLDLVKNADGNHRIIFMTNYDSKNKNKYKKNNTLLQSIAKKNDNVSLINWADAVSEDPGKYISSDGIHPTAEGQKLFAKLIDEAVNDAGSSSSSSNSDVDLCEPRGHSPYTGDGIPQYFQCDPKWGSLMYGSEGIHGKSGTNICDSGCGPTSFAMMATALLGEEILPSETSDIAGKAKMHVPNEGSSHEITSVLAKHYRLEYKAIDTCNIDTINKYLREGWMIHTSGAGGLPFSSGGHYIGITSVSDDGKWYIADSAAKSRPNGYYAPSAVIGAGMQCGNVRAIKAK